MTAIIASAPGSLMICGEHAVVYGHSAIVCAADARVTITLTPRKDNRLSIRSSLANFDTDCLAPDGHPKLRFVLQAVRQQPPPSGITLQIASQIDPTLGLGSSAAVTCATAAALAAYAGADTSLPALHRSAHQTILAVQGRGSGADLAASLWGGMIAYQAAPLAVTPLPIPALPLSLRYAGYKTPTAEVLAIIAAKMAIQPDIYQHLYQRMGSITKAAVQAAAAANWPDFYTALNAYQICMAELGVCDSTQAAHLEQACRTAAAAKISGSGLGDCIIAFAPSLPNAHHPVSITPQGILIKR